jgi:ferredoxin
VVELSAPSGKYVLPESSRQPIILLAGGIGITPFMSLLESLPDGDPMEIWLFYANRNSRTHTFRSQIADHRLRLPGLKVFNHYGSPLSGDICGLDFDSPHPITADVVPEDLIARGVPRFDIFRELFSAPVGPILALAEREGITLPSGCRVGQCESCAVPIVSGRVTYLDGVDSDDPSVCLTCSAIPTSDLVLDAWPRTLFSHASDDGELRGGPDGSICAEEFSVNDALQWHDSDRDRADARH